MIWFVDALLFAIAAVLALIAATRGRVVLRDSAREGALDFIKLMPRIMLGVVGAGYIAALLPQEVVGRWLGADSGITGIAIAMIGGALTPGGPVIGFSVGAAALKGGAGTPQVIAYCTAWALFAVQRLYAVTVGAGAITIALTGTGTIAAYQAAIDSITFASSSDNPSTTPRNIEVAVNDGADVSNTATTTINVTPTNDAPVADDDEPAASAFSGNALENDSDPDQDTILVTGIRPGAEGPGEFDFVTNSGTTTVTGVYGTLQIAADGTYTYTLNPNDPDTLALAAQAEGAEQATDVFTYRISDGEPFDEEALTDTAEIRISIDGVNDAPAVDSVSLTISEGQTATLSAVDFGITDPDDTSFTYTVSAVTGGYFQLSSDAGTPIESFSSADLTGGLVQFVDDGDEVAPSFSVTVNDGDADSNTLAATVNYTPVNDAPAITAAALDNHVLTSSGGYVPSRSVDQSVQLSSLGISGDGAVTVEFWLNTADTVYSLPFGFYQYDLLVAETGGPNNERVIGFNTGSGDIYGALRTDLVGQWHHIAAIFDNGDAEQSTLYIDGVEQTLSRLYASPSNAFANFNTNTARIGGYDVNSQFALDGQIDEVRIWHGERTAAEIAATMNDRIVGSQPNLVADYSFENVANGANGVADSSGNGHHGTFSTLTTADVIPDADLNLDLGIIPGQPLVFSSANHTGITVGDIDSANLTVTLAVSHGILTLASLSGVTITGGENGTATVTITGAVSNLNTALDGLSYEVNGGYDGHDLLVVIASDGALSTTKTIALSGIDPLEADPNDNDTLIAEVITTSGSHVFGTVNADTISGQNGGQTMFGGPDNDTINAGNGSDLIFGGSGNDEINGNNGGDRLYGGSGDDTATGGAGIDTLVGGLGADTLTGGQSPDIFVFENLTDSLAAGFDTITDLQAGDSLSIGHILAGLTTGLSLSGTGNLASDLASVLNTGNLLGDGAAEVIISGGSDAGTYVVIGDATAGFNAAADAVVRLSNNYNVQTSNFVV